MNKYPSHKEAKKRIKQSKRNDSRYNKIDNNKTRLKTNKPKTSIFPFDTKQ